MKVVEGISALRSQVRAWRAAGERVVLVPTMGNLHAGHLRLVEVGREHGERIVASVFVNPTQFGAGEDFDKYPRTLDADAKGLQGAGADLLFAPPTEAIYPGGVASATIVEPPPELANILCGAFRPGHFRGVATVVAKLFNLVQPDVAVFGEKDFQQLMIIRRLTTDLNFPIDIVGVPTVREADGLAMSSRNGYLSVDERAIAPALHGCLVDAADRLRAGVLIDDVECGTIRAVDGAGLRCEYVSVRRAADLGDPGPSDKNLVILVAARLGAARLIDNLRCNLN
ncbi:MAG: pantoate--beta-alanine ligase [Chromatiales bacterium]|nr:pantoate--beta-alanine ligase [Gammaproteobacteria bacterium]MCP5352818.1 pantoate--beta-alanine ligase [Chromatiales bacterium]